MGRESMQSGILVVGITTIVLGVLSGGLSIPRGEFDSDQLSASDGTDPGFASHTSVGTPITESEYQRIRERLQSFGLATDIGEVERLSVDSFSVVLRDGTVAHISLRADHILTQGDLSHSEIDAIKNVTLRRRGRVRSAIRSIRQISANTVRVMTGGSAGGDILVFERRGETWEVESAGRWVE